MQEPEDIDTLVARIEGGWSPAYLFFWGHTAPPGPLGKACLSQWFPAPFVVDGVRYATAEHFMMHRKALLFRDEAVAGEILASGPPAHAKALGRRVRDFDAHEWKRHRSSIVRAGSYAKFSQNPELRRYLLQTGDQVLVEASPTDTIWGIGLAERDPLAREPARWRGLNLLGFALMHARERLRAEVGDPP